VIEETYAEFMRMISISLDVVGGRQDLGVEIKLPVVPLVGEKILVHREHEAPKAYRVLERSFFHWHDDDDTRERVELKVEEVEL
jgi:hypothetical protein